MENELYNQIKEYVTDLNSLSKIVLNNESYRSQVLCITLGESLESYKEESEIDSIEEAMPMILELCMSKIVNGDAKEDEVEPVLFGQLMQFIEKHELNGKTKRR